MTYTSRPIALITGASGGMGRTCARTMGATMDLVLTDVAAAPLDALAGTLRDEGCTVLSAQAGDLGNSALLADLVETASKGGGLGTLVHTAGVSPAQADWKTILRVNSLVTAQLVAALEPVLRPGSVGVLVASMAGYQPLLLPEVDRIIDEAETDADFAPIEAFLYSGAERGAEAEMAASGRAYVLSKRAVQRLCERKASTWGERGARIVSVSPGLIYTPMGRKEADGNAAIAATTQAQPVSRWGTSMDIAAAVSFLASPAAGFITGCDLRIDGGATALARSHQRAV